MIDRQLRGRIFVFTAVVCLLVLGLVCRLLLHPRTAVVVTIDEIGVSIDGLVTIGFSYQVRRDSTFIQGWRELNGSSREIVGLEEPMRGMGPVERWRTDLTDSTLLEFSTPHAASVESLVEQGRRYHLAHGATLPLMRVDRLVDSSITREECFIAISDPSTQPTPTEVSSSAAD